MYNDNYKCVFVHINKTGGTTINNALNMKFEGDFQHLSVKRILELKPLFSSYFKFAFVRNPWDWVISEIHHRKQKSLTIPVDEEFNVKLLEKYFGDDSESWAEMSYFKTKRVGTGYQKSFLYIDDRLAVDYVGRFERYKENLAEIYSILGINGIKKQKILSKHDNSTQHSPYYEYYNDDTKEYVRKLFEEDIDTFKYTFLSTKV